MLVEYEVNYDSAMITNFNEYVQNFTEDIAPICEEYSLNTSIKENSCYIEWWDNMNGERVMGMREYYINGVYVLFTFKSTTSFTIPASYATGITDILQMVNTLIGIKDGALLISGQFTMEW